MPSLGYVWSGARAGRGFGRGCWRQIRRSGSWLRESCGQGRRSEPSCASGLLAGLVGSEYRRLGGMR
ncbi:hypothetical protein KFK09_025732 [Dendrobium nobile]|uniref:Uncharacterized protein n=1 Tax=Dendrobium nobile TaxID=94219 RepID=A0A8T3A6P5_DENNO|nr:hypothetical protein KFK09_025732 [Dendrobium nobile]